MARAVLNLPSMSRAVLIDSRFDVTSAIGRGGSAIVFEAFDRVAKKHVALKVLSDTIEDPEVAFARLAREARAARAITHPNVCSTYDFGRLDNGRAFVSMELLRGESLRAYLRRTPRLDPEEAIEIAVQVLAGLEAAHALGVVHRDVKPENVFLAYDLNGFSELRVKVLDFGVCRRVADPLDSRTLTQAGCVVGTPGYFAPEQAYGDRKIDHRVDLFAVGVILYETLTGRPVYESRNTTELSVALARRVPSLMSVCPDSGLLDRVIARATEFDPEVRYPSAAHFLHDLLEARTAMRRQRQRSSRRPEPEPTNLRSGEEATYLEEDQRRFYVA